MLTARADGLSPAMRGAFWMLVAGMGFAIVPAAVRLLSESMPVFEIVFLRVLFALLPSLPLIAHSGIGGFKTKRLGAHSVRAGLNYLAMLTYFWGISVVPIADAVSIQFLIPVVTALGAAALLRERVGWQRWSACFIGAAGAAIIVRPGFQTISPHMFSILASAGFYAVAWMMVKILTRTESASVTVFYLNLLLIPVSLVPALYVWVPPNWSDFLPLAALGLGGWVAHFAQARAFASADVSAMAPLDFLRLPFVAILGFVLFDQLPDIFTWIGAGVIVVAATYLTREEVRRAAARVIADGANP